jgi:SAM-dependent methyltransferase
MGINLHQDLINKNHELWNRKPILRTAYQDLYRIAAAQLSGLPDSKIVELGSGMGHIRDVIPNCITTELFPFPWIDQIENAYKLSFEDESISDLISTDVFHHLKYPGNALDEFHRVLRRGGRHEPVGIARVWSVSCRANCHHEENRMARPRGLVAR